MHRVVNFKVIGDACAFPSFVPELLFLSTFHGF